MYLFSSGGGQTSADVLIVETSIATNHTGPSLPKNARKQLDHVTLLPVFPGIPKFSDQHATYGLTTLTPCSGRR